MKFKLKSFAALLLLATLNLQISTASAQGTAFTYQGRLNDGANPANGIYDLRFAIYDLTSGGSQVGSILTNSATGVTNGLFTVALDFGANIFTNGNRFLEIGVRTNGGGAFANLTPRQKMTPTPYAITAGNLSGALPAGQLSGTIGSANVAGTYGNAVTFNNPSNSFGGNGAGLTNLNAANLTGTLPDARLSANVALLAGSQTFTGSKTFSNLVIAPSGVRVDRTNVWFTGDQNHGVGYFGSGRPFAGAAPDGPVLFGFGGGALGTEQYGSERVALLWNNLGVGIGTAAPDRPLVVQANGSSELIGLKDNTGATRWHFNLQSGGLNLVQSAVADGRLFFGTNGNVGIGTLAPAAILDVVGAIRTRTGGIVFPDGSVQTRAATGSTSPTTASGHPVGATVAVTLNGSPCTLDGPLTITGSVSVSSSGPTDEIQPGNLSHAKVRVTRSRPVGVSDWATAFRNITITGIPPSNPTNWFTLTVSVTQSGGATQSITFSNFLFMGYSLTGNGGQLSEVADLIAWLNPVPIVRAGSLPATTPSADVPGLSVLTNGVALAGAVLASLPLAALPVISPSGSTVNSINISLNQTLTLRANLSGGAGLLAWQQGSFASPSVARNITIRQGGVTLVAADDTVGKTYRLRLADDGLPIEELDVAFVNLTAP